MSSIVCREILRVDVVALSISAESCTMFFLKHPTFFAETTQMQYIAINITSG